MNDFGLSTAVVLKPSKTHTVHRLQAAILCAIPSVPRPEGVVVDWLAGTKVTLTV